jgi:hypothetical protein
MKEISGASHSFAPIDGPLDENLLHLASRRAVAHGPHEMERG